MTPPKRPGKKPVSFDAGHRECWRAFRGLFNATHVGLICMSRDMTVEWINAAAASMLGNHSPEDMAGKNIFALVPELRARKPIYDRVLEGEWVDFSDAEVPVGGTTRTYDVHYRPIHGPDGGVAGFVTIVYEITRQQQAERELQITEEKYRTLYNATPNMVLAVELPSGTIVECNHALCTTLGYARSEVVGRKQDEFYHPGCMDRVRADMEVLGRAGEVRGSELHVLRKDGGAIDVEMNSAAFHDLEGNIAGFRAVWHDITERKLAERKLLASEAQLRELSNRVLDIQEDERKRLAREFHDEVGQIFTALRMDLARIRSRMSGGEATLLEQMKSMDAMIGNSIRRVRQIAMGLRPDILDSLGLVAALEWLVDDFEKHGNIPCRLRVEPEGLTVRPRVATSVFRIAQEALTNVARHSGATRAEVRLENSEQTLSFEVSDDGTGIGPKGRAGEKALGLRNMQERAQLVGGELTIEPSSPSGTRVLVRIPLATGPS